MEDCHLKKPEILAPAGSAEALRAAIYAGADAVYLGGSRFGARAYADNFDSEALLEAIEYAHLYGVKVYLTINTLFRNKEIEQLFGYLVPLYEAGLDAVIVQDVGVMSYVHAVFPDLPIHASTQMAITTEYAYELLRDYGVTRIVPARELSLDEIAGLKGADAVFVPEVEVFVQGALCYCYSGQCLMSSMLGGRSGNRGRCAQPCRLAYEVSEENGTVISGAGEYVLSPKDLCGLDSISDLIHAGVDSFKIEGRMKKAEYVAACVRAYRTCVDAWFDGRLTKQLVNRCRQEMAEVFNRGGFTDGYYHRHNGGGMMSLENPGNAGVKAGNVCDIRKNQLVIALSQDVSVRDILMVDTDGEPLTLTCNAEGRAGEQIVLNAPRTKSISNGAAVKRVHKEALYQELSGYGKEKRKLAVKGCIHIYKDTAVCLILKALVRGKEYTVTVEGELVERAKAKPLDAKTVYEKITACGNTEYRFEQLEIEMDEGIFYPLKALKELRRNGLESLGKEICDGSRRVFSKEKDEEERPCKGEAAAYQKKEQAVAQTAVMISSRQQYDAVLEFMSENILRKNYADIYLDLQYFNKEDIINRIERHTEFCHFLVLPPVFRKYSIREAGELIKKIQAGGLACHGIVVRNLDELAYVKHMGYEGSLIADYSLYGMNTYAVDWLHEQYPGVTVTLPVELKEAELPELISGNTGTEWIVYGYQQLMVSAQCIQNTIKGCDKADKSFVLKDRFQKPFFVRCICKYCYNLIYNGVPTVLFDVGSKAAGLQAKKRLQFTIEDRAETKRLLETYFDGQSFDGEKTRGHYRRGVE